MSRRARGTGLIQLQQPRERGSHTGSNRSPHRAPSASGARSTAPTSSHTARTVKCRACARATTPCSHGYGSESRLTAEIVLDRGLGDLFVVRTAGHTSWAGDPGQHRTWRQHAGDPLIVVLGQDSSGAVASACAALQDGSTPGGYIRDVVERVTPSVLAARAAGRHTADEILDEHVRHTVDLLLDRFRILAERVATGQTAVVGLCYRLADGSAPRAAVPPNGPCYTGRFGHFPCSRGGATGCDDSPLSAAAKSHASAFTAAAKRRGRRAAVGMMCGASAGC
ncbi:carbonic anhydrase [Streptomyces sp. NPDC058335]|uniref:carbonic anhydrase n=1 Tax=Streptomyces sp. NPDC058335 TaxID=3346451 RepID=UPI003655E573